MLTTEELAALKKTAVDDLDDYYGGWYAHEIGKLVADVEHYRKAFEFLRYVATLNSDRPEMKLIPEAVAKVAEMALAGEDPEGYFRGEVA